MGVVCQNANKGRRTNPNINPNITSEKNELSKYSEDVPTEINKHAQNNNSLESDACQIALDDMVKNEIELEKEIKKLEAENHKLNEEKIKLENKINKIQNDY